ncbi:hypothetical protein DSCW_24880 [Desulfosarcina widdelii]|uniref:Uncharacterized protein n=1 Tax=Desulfosarcina widdelii TaxID=947919 RepID=A0A5K7Z5Z1_9BACT|nr:hypothetical protein [Desulfosarcina widdelii]BBO75071.1 hypothetical protein DSCW_24880 [Desulfosarcina widdelii]
MRAKISTMLLVLAALAGMVLAITGMADRGLEYVGLEKLSRTNHRYLDESYDRALEGFLVLSAVKSGLAVIEGSEVGIGFSFEVGDLVQSVYDYVNIAWKTVLAGGTILLITRLALDGVTLVDHWVLTLVFFLLFLLAAVQGLFPRRRVIARIIKSMTAACGFVAVLLYLVLPLAVLSASWLSDALTRPLIQESYDTFNQVSLTFLDGDATGDAGETSGDASSLQSAQGLRERYGYLKKRLHELETYLGAQAKSLAGTTFQLIAGYLFDCVIFPLAFAAVLFFFLKGFPGYLVQVERDRRMVRAFREATAQRPGQPPSNS